MFNSSSLVNAMAGLSVGLLIFVLLIVLGFVVVNVIANWKIFEKNGEEGWKAIIPFYNSYIFTKIAGLNWWYALILIFASIFGNSSDNSSMQLLLQLASMFMYFLIFHNLAIKAKKDPISFGILGALFSPIIEIIMGFSKEYQFDNSVELNPNGIFGEKTQAQTKTQSTESEKYCLGCGKKLKPDSKFCENCGKPVE